MVNLVTPDAIQTILSGLGGTPNGFKPTVQVGDLKIRFSRPTEYACSRYQSPEVDEVHLNFTQ